MVTHAETSLKDPTALDSVPHAARLGGSPGPLLPTGRAAWGIYALVVLILGLSSVAPFVQMGRGGPQVAADDIRAALVYLATWVPFVALLAWYATRRPTGAWSVAWTWVGHVALVCVVPSLHALAFLGAEAVRSGSAFAPGDLIGSPPFQVLTLLGTLQYLVLAAVFFAVRAGRLADERAVRTARLELDQARLESQLARARVDAFAAQLQPHFLFNTLNSISVLAVSDPAAAQLMVRRLSALLRAALVDDAGVTVPLAREIELVTAYTEIQRVRFGDRLRLRVDVDPAVADCAVPTLILQPLVENAIQHAVSDREDGGTIGIAARRHGDQVVLEVTDDGAGPPRPGESPPVKEASGQGVGHRNTRERIRQLYGDRQSFTIARGADGRGCVVTIEIPMTPAAAPGGRVGGP